VSDRIAVQIGPEALGTYLCGRAEQVVKVYVDFTKPA
jgi:hypothetical protein